MSIHIGAPTGAIAEGILLPGDPLRAKFIAETYFEKAERFNEVRSMHGFTGLYQGKRVSVMGTGMGMPSLSIYVNELIRDYGAKRLVRVGTCGAIRREIGIRDIVLAMSASTDSSMNRIRFRGMDYAPSCSFSLLMAAREAALARGVSPHVGPILSSDSFYSEDPDQWKLWASFGILAIEMESSELYTLAAKFGVEALSVLTVSDHLLVGEATSSAERETSLRTMAEIGLAALLA